MALNVKNILAKREKSAKAAAKFAASRGRKFVLFIGDEGAILIYIKGNKVEHRQFVPDASQHSLDELRASFERDNKAPLMLVIDTMDQSYVQQSLPPVSSLSVGKLIKRRIDREFPNTDIKGSLLLGREQSGRKDWNFLMVAVEQTPQLSVWIDFIAQIPNRFTGIHLIAIESENFIKALEQSMGVPKTGTGSEWKFFVSHNKSSGFRQVVLHRGRVIFTRLAQPLGDMNAEVIAGNIEQEMLSTIEYMKRLSYTSQAGLDVYIITSEAVKNAIDRKKIHARQVVIFTPYEVGQNLHIEGATQPADQFGDVILGSFIGCNRRHVLTLFVSVLKKINGLFKGLIAIRACVALIALSLLAFIMMQSLDLFQQSQKIEELGLLSAQKQAEFEALKQEVQRTGLDVEGASDIIDIYKRLQSERLSPILFLQQLSPLRQLPVRLSSISWGAENKDEKNTSGSAEKIFPVNSTLVLELPSSFAPREAYESITGELLSGIKQAYPNFEVKYLKLKDFKVSETLTIELGAKVEEKPAESKTDEKLEVSIQISGPYSMNTKFIDPSALPPEADKMEP